jgi:hypothetical protein
MPERATLVAVLILERPLCVSCISEKSGHTPAEIESFLAQIERTVDVRRGVDRCRACGTDTTVYSLLRRD